MVSGRPLGEAMDEISERFTENITPERIDDRRNPSIEQPEQVEATVDNTQIVLEAIQHIERVSTPAQAPAQRIASRVDTRLEAKMLIESEMSESEDIDLGRETVQQQRNYPSMEEDKPSEKALEQHEKEYYYCEVEEEV